MENWLEKYIVVEEYLTLFHAGGGKFTLSAIYRLKSPESGDKGGVMGY